MQTESSFRNLKVWQASMQLEIAKRAGFLAETDYLRFHTQAEEVGRMLNRLLSFIQEPSDY